MSTPIGPADLSERFILRAIQRAFSTLAIDIPGARVKEIYLPVQEFNKILNSQETDKRIAIANAEFFIYQIQDTNLVVWKEQK